jgi:hypothetical protein
MEEGVALMGTHSLVDDQVCSVRSRIVDASQVISAGIVLVCWFLQRMRRAGNGRVGGMGVLPSSAQLVQHSLAAQVTLTTVATAANEPLLSQPVVQGCMVGPNDSQLCNPRSKGASGCGNGANQRMFNLSNIYYKDVCTPYISVRARDPASPDPADTAPGVPNLPLKDLPKPAFEHLKNHEMCKVGWRRPDGAVAN